MDGSETRLTITECPETAGGAIFCFTFGGSERIRSAPPTHRASTHAPPDLRWLTRLCRFGRFCKPGPHTAQQNGAALKLSPTARTPRTANLASNTLSVKQWDSQVVLKNTA